MEEKFNNPEATFLKKVTYCSTNIEKLGELTAPSLNLATAFKLIKEIQKLYKTRETEKKEKFGWASQYYLIIVQGKSQAEGFVHKA